MKSVSTLLLAAAAIPATAQVSNVVYSVSAVSSLGAGQVEFTQSDVNVTDNGDGSFTLTFAGNIDILDGGGSGNVIATLTSADVVIDPGFGNTDPRISLAFSVENGAADTVFSISSGTNMFGQLPSADALAVASVSLTTGDGSQIDASGLLGNATVGNNHFYGAFTGNSVDGDPSFPFTDGIAFLLPDAISTSTSTISSDIDPFGPISGPFDAIAASFSFELAANAQLSGTSNLIVTPTPGAAAIVALGGVVATRRRR
ncbi:MAG: hypothetical protein AAGI17_01020 [Planctomycetota bacterium]